MRTSSGGYILVLRDRRSAWAGARVHVSRFPGEAWLARARRLLRHGRRIPPGLRLVSSHYTDDPARLCVQLAAMLGPRFAEGGRAPEARLRRMLAEALTQDRARLQARFDPGTGLFRLPGDVLPGPVKRLVAQWCREIVVRTPAQRRIHATHLRHPYAMGLLWPLLGERLEAAGIPACYRAETWRALVRALAGCHLTDAEMTATLAAVNDQTAEYRVGAWEYRRFSRRARGGGTPGLDRVAFYLLDPQDHMMRGLADYRRRVHGSVPVRLAIWMFRVLQVVMLAATAAAVAWLLLRVQSGLMPGLTLFFAAGAAIIAGRLYRRPDMAKLFGRVSERALERARAVLESAPVRVAAPPSTATPSGPHPAAGNIPHPADIPSPVPVPVPVAIGPEAERPAPAQAGEAAISARKATPSVEDIARAWTATPPGGPIPYPVPRPAEDAEAPAEPSARTSGAPEGGQARLETFTDDWGVGAFVLGWGMPIPVPNWMAASAPDAPPPSSRQVKDGEEAERARISHPRHGLRPDGQAARRNQKSVAEATVEGFDDADTRPHEDRRTGRTENEKCGLAIRNAGIFHAPPLPPVLPSAAFWGIESAGLPAGCEPRPGSGDGSRRRNS